jgi:hypothetical protein
VLNELTVWLLPAVVMLAGVLARRVQWLTLPQRLKR